MRAAHRLRVPHNPWRFFHRRETAVPKRSRTAPLSAPTPAPLRRLTTLAALAGAAACSALLALDAHAARLAMVVGNDAYQNVSKLRNARNDAQSLAKELEVAGFSVTRVLDASRDTLNDQLDGFLRRIEKGDEVVFFFSGHGSQPPQLGPFLLPVDIRVTGERAISRDGLSLEQLVDDLNRRARFSLVIVDACRDDPFHATTAGRSLPAGSGLGRIEPPKGSMIIMAASKGQQALDRLGNADTVPNGLFTRELIKQIRTKGLSASDMLKRVRTSVESSAATVNHAQRPSLVDESSSDFFFYPAGGGPAPAAAAFPAPAPPPAPAPAPAPVVPTPAPAPARVTTPAPAPYAPAATPAPLPAPAPAATRPYSSPSPSPAGATTISEAQREFDAWEAAQRSNTRSALDSFVAQYPQGRYTPAARSKIGGMAAAPAAAPAATPAPQRAAANNPQAEFEVWDRAATSKTRADYEAYLRAYPGGRYAEIARAALQKLK